MKKIYKVMSLTAISSILLNPISALALTKTETVYSNLDHFGNTNKTVVNVELKDLEKGDIVDYTNLDNIKNINGKEKFSKDSEKVTWKSNGKDIVYQGKINEELPIKIDVKYYLNEKEVNPKDIKNKSGNIKVIYNLKNTSYDYNSGMYNPFVITMVTNLSAKNKNINVTNGKVVNTGTKNVITALAAPGLYESIPIDTLKDMNQIILTYETEKYESNEVYFVITPKLLENVDIENLSKLDSISSSINKLQNGTNELEKGSYALSEGLSSLNDGLETLNSSLKDALDGSIEITSGLTKINDNKDKLLGLNTLIDTLYSNYQNNNQLLQNIQNGTISEELKSGIVNATAKKTELENKLIEVNTAINSLEQLELNNSLTDELKIKLEELRNNKVQLENGIKEYEIGIAEAENNLNSLPQAAAKLMGANETIEKILIGLLRVDNKDYINDTTIELFKNEMIELTNGISVLQVGSNNLSNGLSQIYEGSNKLIDGSNKLKDGSTTLHDGIVKVNNEGINKLSNYASKIATYKDKTEALIKLSKNYKGFSNNNSDNTIFIYKVEK